MDNVNNIGEKAKANTPMNSTGMLKSIPKENKLKQSMVMILISAIVVVLGVTTGWYMSGAKAQSSTDDAMPTVSGSKQTQNEAGIDDTGTFSDTAEGVLMEGGLEGEGTHYLDRNAGPDKQVYLTSTVIDLQSFVGKKVQVWGETIAAKHAPWLMDVGKLKVVE